MIVTLDPTLIPIPMRESLGETSTATTREGQPAGFHPPPPMTRGHVTPILEP